MSRETPSSSIIEKTILVIDTILAARTPLRFSDIVAETGLNKSTSHRILQNLIPLEIVRYDEETRSYGGGTRILTWAQRYLAEGDLRLVAEPVMERLAAQVGQNVLMAIREQCEVVYINRIDTLRTDPVIARIGARAPIQCTSLGKCLLAFSSESVQSQVIAHLDWIASTENTITDPARLRADLRETRRRGFAIDDREHQANVHCIAAPISNVTGKTIAAISITANIFRVERGALLAWAPRLKAAALAISTGLGAEGAQARRRLVMEG